MAEVSQATSKGAIPKTATPADIPAIRAIITAAYSKYTERIGKEPAPMSADYEELLRTHDVYVLKSPNGNKIIASMVLSEDESANAIRLNNLVVDPSLQGGGFGRRLFELAEEIARSKGRNSLVLYTNVKMYENLGLYAKIGFVETGRGTEDGFERIYFRKVIS